MFKKFLRSLDLLDLDCTPLENNLDCLPNYAQLLLDGERMPGIGQIRGDE